MFVLYRETRNGVFDLGGHSRLSVILEELAALQRAGERSPLRIVDGAGKLVLRSEPLPQGEAASVVFERLRRGSVGQGAGLSQHVQVKSAVESHFETFGSGGQAVSGVVFWGKDLGVAGAPE